MALLILIVGLNFPRLTISSIFGAIPFISKMHPALWDKNKIKQTYPAWSHTDGQYVGHRSSPSAVDAGVDVTQTPLVAQVKTEQF